MGGGTQDLCRVEAAGLKPIQFAGQVERVTVAVLRIADLLGDLGFPAAYGRRVEGVDLALLVTGVPSGAVVLEAWFGSGAPPVADRKSTPSELQSLMRIS